MAKQIKESAKVLGISYKTTSYYGNPSYWVKFETAKGEILKGYTLALLNLLIAYFKVSNTFLSLLISVVLSSK